MLSADISLSLCWPYRHTGGTIPVSNSVWSVNRPLLGYSIVPTYATGGPGSGPEWVVARFGGVRVRRSTVRANANSRPCQERGDETLRPPGRTLLRLCGAAACPSPRLSHCQPATPGMFSHEDARAIGVVAQEQQRVSCPRCHSDLLGNRLVQLDERGGRQSRCEAVRRRVMIQGQPKRLHSRDLGLWPAQ